MWVSCFRMEMLVPLVLTETLSSNHWRICLYSGIYCVCVMFLMFLLSNPFKMAVTLVLTLFSLIIIGCFVPFNSSLEFHVLLGKWDFRDRNCTFGHFLLKAEFCPGLMDNPLMLMLPLVCTCHSKYVASYVLQQLQQIENKRDYESLRPLSVLGDLFGGKLDDV